MATVELASHRPIPIVNLKSQYESLREEILVAIREVLENQHFILGPNVLAFEKEIAELCNTPFAVGVASGTDALILALRACNIGPGDEVIVPAFTFVATADAVSILGATPVFCDIKPDTFNIDPHHAASLVSSRTKAIVPVHLYGQPVDMDAIVELAGKHDLYVIEDCAQALGAKWNGKPTCSQGDFGCISFFPSKNLGAYGDGGMVTARTSADAVRLRGLRSHGSSRKYHSEYQGMNSRLDELQAAILRVKLPHLEKWGRDRRRVAGLYNEALRGVEGLVAPAVDPRAEHVYHQFTVQVDNRDEVQQALSAVGVQTFVYYPVPLHLQAMYKELGYAPGSLPVAEAAAMKVLSLPIWPEMTAIEVSFIAEQLTVALQRKAS